MLAGILNTPMKNDEPNSLQQQAEDTGFVLKGVTSPTGGDSCGVASVRDSVDVFRLAVNGEAGQKQKAAAVREHRSRQVQSKDQVWKGNYFAISIYQDFRPFGRRCPAFNNSHRARGKTETARLYFRECDTGGGTLLVAARFVRQCDAHRQ